MEKKNLTEELGLKDKEVRRYLRKHPHEAGKLAKTLIKMEENRQKSKSLFGSIGALNQWYTGGGLPIPTSPQEFSFNKTLVVVSVIFIFLLFLTLIIFSYF